MRSGRFRSALIIVTCIVMQPVGKPAWAEQSASVTISVLRDLVDILKISGEAIANIGDGVAHVAKLAESGYNTVKAKQDQERLKDIYTRLGEVSTISNDIVIGDLDRYVSMYDRYKELTRGLPYSSLPSISMSRMMEKSWRQTTRNISQTLPKIRALLDDVKAERSDFIIEQPYLELLGTLSSRENILQSIADLPQPQTDEEIELIRQAAAEYRILKENLRRTLDAISEYLKNH